MIDYQNTYFYTCNELTSILNNPITDEQQKMKILFCKLYEKSENMDFYASYVQNKLYNAKNKGYIGYVECQKSKRKQYCFSVPDIIKFLNSVNAKHVQGNEKIENIKYIGAKNGR